MIITVLGTRGNVKVTSPQHSKHSGILIDNVLLFDLGEKDFLKFKPKWVFITHLHPDHAFFVTERNPLPISIPVYSPEKHPLTTLITNPVNIGPYKISPIPTLHSKRVKSVAYLLEKGNQRILYTADLIWIEKKYHHLFGRLDLVITEGSYLRKGGLVRRNKQTGQIYGHTGIPDLINLFKPYARKILFVHFGSWFYKNPKNATEKIKKLEKQSGINLVLARDGLKIKLV